MGVTVSADPGRRACPKGARSASTIMLTRSGEWGTGHPVELLGGLGVATHEQVPRGAEELLVDLHVLLPVEIDPTKGQFAEHPRTLLGLTG